MVTQAKLEVARGGDDEGQGGVASGVRVGERKGVAKRVAMAVSAGLNREGLSS